MKRKVMDLLKRWRDAADRKPLIVEGARQVGKTYLIEEFGRACFDEILKIDLSNPSEHIVQLFEGEITPERIIADLELYYGTKIDPERTLLFFDEIQEVPRVLTALKYFCENAPEYHIVVAGSLLGVFLGAKSRSSFPVGKVDRIKLGPMDFEEFLWANGMTEIAESVKGEPENQLFDERLRDVFQQYLVVGGMPAAVANWVKYHDVRLVKNIQRAILSDYEDDFNKYCDSVTATRIRRVYDSLPRQFAKNTDRFLYGVIRESAKARDYEVAIDWLANSGIARRVEKVVDGGRLPLKAYVDKDAFKLYFLDIGLFRELAEIPPAVVLEKNAIFDEFNGFFAEQFVLQQLADKRRSIYYWTGATSEVDFVVQAGAKIIPVEVKSGENVHSKSLRVYREKYHPELVMRFSMLPYQKRDEMWNVPLYKVFCVGLEE